jgi:hypothetical protein
MQGSLVPDMQLICSCCGQTYYPDKSFGDKLLAVYLGTERFAICPVCTQQVPQATFDSPAYRTACLKAIRRMQRLFEAELKQRKLHP